MEKLLVELVYSYAKKEQPIDLCFLQTVFKIVCDFYELEKITFNSKITSRKSLGTIDSNAVVKVNKELILKECECVLNDFFKVKKRQSIINICM